MMDCDIVCFILVVVWFGMVVVSVYDGGYVGVVLFVGIGFGVSEVLVIVWFVSVWDGVVGLVLLLKLGVFIYCVVVFSVIGLIVVVMLVMLVLWLDLFGLLLKNLLLFVLFQ